MKSMSHYIKVGKTISAPRWGKRLLRYLLKKAFAGDCFAKKRYFIVSLQLPPFWACVDAGMQLFCVDKQFGCFVSDKHFVLFSCRVLTGTVPQARKGNVARLCCVCTGAKTMAGTLARCKGYDPTRFYISQECSRGLRKEPGRGLGLTKVLFHLVPTLFMVYLVYLIGNINTLPVIFFVKDLYWVMMRRLQRRSQSGAAKPETNLSLFFCCCYFGVDLLPPGMS